MEICKKILSGTKTLARKRIKERKGYKNGFEFADEYWIVDWHKKQVELYELDYDEKGEPQYYLWKTVTEETKDELRFIHFPNLKITFDKLFAEVDMEY